VAVARPRGKSAEQGSGSDDEPPPTAPTKKWRGRRLILVGAAAAVAVVAAIAATLYVVGRNNNSGASRPAPAAVLDGTYRRDYDFAKQTRNGAPDPQPNTNNSSWWAYRSVCTSTGCVATGTKLDDKNHAVAQTPAVTMTLHFVDGRWQDDPINSKIPGQRCLGADGKTVAAGTDTMAATFSWEPQPDGTLRGVETATTLTSDCGFGGRVVQVPFVATRLGDVPPGVNVADPATVTASPATSTPPPAVAGPVLDGTFRVDYDFPNETVNGAPMAGPQPQTDWWAFHSLCRPSGCVATGAALAAANHQEAAGNANVVRFVDGNWRDMPHIGSPPQCPEATNGTATDIELYGWSFEPQPDGTLRGAFTVTILTNECGNHGTVYKTPILATRVGDVPPAVVLADPALFQS